MRNKFLAIVSAMASTFVASSALAQNIGATEYDVSMWKAMAAAIAISVAAVGGAIGQGRAAAAALEGIARNPNASGKIFVPLILSLALIESLVIYALLIAGGFIGPLAG